MTGQTLLTTCFQDIGAYAAGETLTASDAQDGLRRLNNLISGWRTQYGTVTAIERWVFPLTANQQTYTIGNGGDFNVPRPVMVTGAGLLLNGLASAQSVTSITRSGYAATVTLTSHGFAVGDETVIAGATEHEYNGVQTVESVPTSNTFTYTVEGTPTTPATGTITSAAIDDAAIEIPRAVITDDAYQSIQLKRLTNNQFTLVYYNPTYPLGTIVLWPMPNVATNQLVLYLQNSFAGFADLSTDYQFPDVPGYAEALQYNLDVRLFTPYGVKDPAIMGPLQELARETLMTIKRTNNKLTDLPNDAAALFKDPRSIYNINTGTGG